MRPPAAFCLFAVLTLSGSVLPEMPQHAARPASQAVAAAPVRPAMAARPAARGPLLPGPYPAEVLAVIDGDTIEVRASIWLGHEIMTRVRLRGIDAAELSSECREERALAHAARDRLAGLLAAGRVRLTDVGRDKYAGRVVARVLLADGSEAGERLLAEGFAIIYDGGRREPWCGPPRLTAQR